MGPREEAPWAGSGGAQYGVNGYGSLLVCVPYLFGVASELGAATMDFLMFLFSNDFLRYVIRGLRG